MPPATMFIEVSLDLPIMLKFAQNVSPPLLLAFSILYKLLEMTQHTDFMNALLEYFLDLLE